jgi:hypothetical protein
VKIYFREFVMPIHVKHTEAGTARDIILKLLPPVSFKIHGTVLFCMEANR